MKTITKKMIKRITSMVLVAAMVTVSPMGEKLGKVVSAEDKVYVSEVVLSYGKTEEDARDWLEKNDYKVVDGDINAGTDSKDAVYSKEVNAVLMGYKTTTDKDKAIRDMAVMNMSGGYEITDMESILTEKTDELKDEYDEFLDLSKEYNTCYKAAVKSKAVGKNQFAGALMAHDILNKYIEDDSGKKMGDYLLSAVKTEKGQEKLFNVILQSNREVVMCMKNILMMASGDGKSTWIKKLSDYNKNKTYFARIKQAKKTNKVAKKYIESKYGEDLDNLVSQWKELRERIKDYISTVEDINEKAEENNDSENIDVINDYFGVDTDTIDELNEEKIQNLGSDEVVESFEENAEQTKAFNDAEQFSETASVVSYLSSVKYGDGTLLDFFLLNPTDDTEDDSSIKSSLTTTLKGEDLKYECAAVFEAMTEAQADTLGEAINLFTAIKYAITDEKNVWNSLENADKKVYKTSLKEINKTSVYSGVDRDMFEDTVALTQAGQTVNKTVFEDVIEGNSGNKAKNITFLSVGAITTAIGLTILGAGVASYINDFQLFNKTTNTMWKNWLLDAERKFSDKFVSLIYGNPQNYIESVVEKMNSGVISVEQYNKALKNFLVVKHMATVVIGVAIAAIGIYFSVKAIIGLVDDRKVYYKGNYSIAIPKYMVDLNRDEDNSVYFNYYKVAMCNRNDEDMTGFKREEEGLKDYGDVNGDNGRQWVALYYSTAETAGDPILADSLEVKYGDTPYDDNYKQLHSFNEPATGFNLTSMVYCYNDKKGGTYLRYKVDKEADNTKITSKSDNNNSAQAASAFSGRGNVGIIVVSGIFGIVLGFFGARLTSQKKKEE